MKTHRIFIPLLIPFLLLTFISFAGCNSADANNKEDQSAKIETTVDIDIQKVAEAIVKDAGHISSKHEGNSGKNIFVFEETHNSVSGQVEIAIMLNRLVKDFGINNVALEGEFTSVGQLKPDWYHKMLPDAGTTKTEFALQTLQEGEINSAEFISLVYPNAYVFGIEDEKEYSLDISEEAQGAVNVYLFGIVATDITQGEYNRFEQLMKDNNIEEALEYLFGLNAFTKEKYEQMTSEKILSAEESIVVYEEIKRKAEAVNAQIDYKYKKGMDEILAFFKMASKRSHTMVDNAFAHATADNYSLIIGAAHTQEIEKLLKEKNHSYVVITPLSLKNKNKEGDLAMVSYKRKMDRLSVDTLLLGKLLSGDKKAQTGNQ